MAYASVLSLAQTIQQILHHDDQNLSTYPHDHKQHVKSLHEHVTLIQAFLDEYPDEATSLEGRITDISNEADDIIGTFMWEHLRSYYVLKSAPVPKRIEYDFQKLSLKQLSPMTYPAVLLHTIEQILQHDDQNPSTSAHDHKQHVKSLHDDESAQVPKRIEYDFHKLSQELQKVTREVRSIVEEVAVIQNTTRIKSVLQLNDSSSPAAAATGGPSSETAPSTGKDHIVVGFDEDLIAIKERLCRGSSTREIIPIHGMGGIGKTTLARYAYDDPLIREYFHIRVWVTVSQDYNLKDIISGLLTSLKQYEGKSHGE